MKKILLLTLIMFTVNFWAKCQFANFKENWTPTLTKKSDTTLVLSKIGAMRALKAANDLKAFSDLLKLNEQVVNIYKNQAQTCLVSVDTLTSALQVSENLKVKFQKDFIIERRKKRISKIENWIWRGLAFYTGYKLITK